MFEVLSNTQLSAKVHRLTVSVPRVARAWRPGQFAIVRKHEGAERIPLSIAGADPKAGTITLVVQAVGVSSRAIVSTPAGECIRDVAGPLGMPSRPQKWGKVACVGGGVGTAVLYPIARAAAEVGNEIYALIGGRTAELVMLAEEFAGFAAEVYVATEDGSLGVKGLVTAILDDMLRGDLPHPDAVIAVGPVAMMAAVAGMTRRQGIPTVVSLNPIMIDGTGMCGGCRVTVGGERKFTCVDGPEFDGHLVDFAGLRQRLQMYRSAEQAATEACRLNEQGEGQQEQAE